MEISDRLKQWHDTFSGDELNAEADRLQKMVMRAFEIYRLPPVNEGGIIYDNSQNRYVLEKLIKKLIPQAWNWEIVSCNDGLYVILGRFSGFIVDDKGNIL